jgi:glycosyltransferase involved in cell wall biosynthesis
MKHSVVIPLYNKEKYVAETIASLAAQTKRPYELIIVDDCSTDDGLDTARRALLNFEDRFGLTQIKIIELDKNRGPGNARNVGLEASGGEIVSFLDADDCYKPDCLEKIGKHMGEESLDLLVLGIRMVPGNTCYPDMDPIREELVALSENLYLIPVALRAVSSPHFIMGVGSNVAVRRKWLAKIRYDTKAFLNEGIDFWYRVLKHISSFPDARIGLFNEICIDVREVEGSLSRINYARWNELEIPVLLKRYRGSNDINDRLLFSMIGQRWFEHAMERLPSAKQKTLFTLCNLGVLIKVWYIRSVKG